MQFILVKILLFVLLSCILASLSASFTCQFPVLLVKKHFPIIKKEVSTMNEVVTKRFLLYFRLMLLVWILIVNSIPVSYTHLRAHETG